MHIYSPKNHRFLKEREKPVEGRVIQVFDPIAFPPLESLDHSFDCLVQLGARLVIDVHPKPEIGLV